MKVRKKKSVLIENLESFENNRCKIYSKLTITSFCSFYSEIRSYFAPFPRVSIVYFEQGNV